MTMLRILVIRNAAGVMREGKEKHSQQVCLRQGPADQDAGKGNGAPVIWPMQLRPGRSGESRDPSLNPRPERGKVRGQPTITRMKDPRRKSRRAQETSPFASKTVAQLANPEQERCLAASLASGVMSGKTHTLTQNERTNWEGTPIRCRSRRPPRAHKGMTKLSKEYVPSCKPQTPSGHVAVKASIHPFSPLPDISSKQDAACWQPRHRVPRINRIG